MVRSPRSARRVLAACYRFRTLAVVELVEGECRYVRKHSVRGLRRNLAIAVARLLRGAGEFRPNLIVTDNTLVAGALWKSLPATPVDSAP